MTARYTATVLLALLLAGCASEGPGVPGAPGQSSGSGSELTLTPFRGDSLPFSAVSGFTAETTLVIRDQAAWTEVWHTLNARLMPEPALPMVDFSQEMVVLVALGTRSSGGYSVRLTGAEEAGQTVTITARETAPGAGCVTTSALTEPVDLARAPRRDGTVTFTLDRVVRECGP